MTRARRGVAVAAIGVAAAVAGVVVAGGHRSSPDAPEPPTTMAVERGTLAATISLRGSLAHRAGPDGEPYTAINRASGTYTELPVGGDVVACGESLYRVDDEPVLLLCGAIPAYRDLRLGDAGNDVRQLNATLHDLGYDAATGVAIEPVDGAFTEGTQLALLRLQQDRGAPATGELRADRAVFLPTAARVATVAGQLGGPAQPGAPVLDATTDTLEVQVALAGAQQRDVQSGQPARVTLPDNTTVAGAVDRVGTVARVVDDGDRADPGAATTTAFIRLDDPMQVRGLDQAPVRIEVTTGGVADALHVPVTAIVGRSGGGYAIEVVRDDGRRDLVAVDLGMLDASAGRVQVQGDLRTGDHVVVPAS